MEPTPVSDRDSGAETVRCQRCNWEGDSTGTGKGQCPECGCFLPTNTVALTHGGRRFVDGRSPMDEAQRVEIRDAVLGDLGGPGEVSTVLARLVDDFAFAVVLRDLLSAHLSAVGPMTKRNQQRAALGAWHRASDRAERLGKLIGLERRAAPVPSLAAYMERRTNENAGGAP